MSDASIPNFKTYAEGEPIPRVDPEDLKRMRVFRPIPGCQWLKDLQAALSPGADVAAVSLRGRMIDTSIVYKLLTPWQHDEELDDAVFRIAATFPLRELKHKSYMIPGDEHFGFDPNVFVQRLIEETGISHVCEPVTTKVPEGGRCYSRFSANFKGQGPPDPEREAKRQARELVWNIWKRFAPSLDKVLSHRDKEQASEVVATFFADFLMDNIDLVREVEASFMAGNGIGPFDGRLDLLAEMERRAQSGGHAA
jgi:hypothetical protein